MWSVYGYCSVAFLDNHDVSSYDDSPDMERLANRDADLARQLHPVDDGYVSPDVT